ncbi:ubiquinol-cytochrome c reductase iron-sulfur subunit [Melioribacter sp. Ez-97]|uniref:QcrA and Rieske domain-containing protein n=1 Tax=Melioribacter sp. Ez-97 TaxID=3423434 RepID=UPI003ED869C1
MTRRKFFETANKIFGFFLILLGVFTAEDKKKKSAGEKIIIPENLNEGFNFIGNVIVVKQSKTLVAFEARCTHLGCLLNRNTGNKIVCNCHGSEYNINGEAIKGPAVKSLNKLVIHTDKKSKNLYVYV